MPSSSRRSGYSPMDRCRRAARRIVCLPRCLLARRRLLRIRRRHRRSPHRHRHHRRPHCQTPGYQRRMTGMRCLLAYVGRWEHLLPVVEFESRPSFQSQRSTRPRPSPRALQIQEAMPCARPQDFLEVRSMPKRHSRHRRIPRRDILDEYVDQ